MVHVPSGRHHLQGRPCLGTGRGQVKESRIATAKELTTPSGVRFALLGERPARPAPVIFQLGGSARDALEIGLLQHSRRDPGAQRFPVGLRRPAVPRA